ncbi:helix-turn-helix transcriptional regulator [Actinoplanes sp. NPDC023714]|uniref:helix-turn-helix transcriptional regulator n=1 Tax=Actinoplanes sp. NPDC023714 TaxID=3154322 RepID=UPI0033D02295
MEEEAGIVPAAIRRAVSYIDARAADPITLDAIAGAARLGVRALQSGFRRHLGTTPLAYLRRVRLENAHRDLQAAIPAMGVTVTEIAGRWGFSDSSRFAASYRAAYGRSPSRTLREEPHLVSILGG